MCTPHGTPLPPSNTTTTPACLCKPGWQGHGNDFFDTRVWPSSAGNGDSPPPTLTQCDVNDLAITVLWVVVVIMILWRQFFTYLGFRTQTHKHQGSLRNIRKRKGWFVLFLYMLRHQTFRVCLVDLLLANPLTMVVAVLKLSRREVLGTDPVSTVAFSAAVPISLFAYASFQVFQFSIVTVRQQHAQLRRVHAYLMFASPVLFTVLASGPGVVMLFLDKTVSPYDNYSGVVLSIRLVGVFLWQFVTAVSLYFLSRESSNVLLLFARTPVIMSEGRKRVLSSQDSKDSSASANNKNMATEAVRHMKNQARVVAMRTGLVILITVPFMVPVLWPYYCYAVPVAVCLVSTTSPGIEMWYIHRAAKAASESTSIMRTSLAPGGVLAPKQPAALDLNNNHYKPDTLGANEGSR